MKEDIPYGKRLIELFRPFIETMISSGLRDKTIRNHIDNLWLLGGEVIRDVSMYEQYDTPPDIKLNDSIGPDGGPYCNDLHPGSEQASFDRTCRK